MDGLAPGPELAGDPTEERPHVGLDSGRYIVNARRAGKGRDTGPRDVPDVDEIPGLPAVAVEGDGLVGEQALAENRHHSRLTHRLLAWPVDVREAQTRGRNPVVPGEEVLPWTRVQVGPDRSLYVLDPARAVIRRHPPGGQPPRILGDPLAIGSLDGFVIDENVGGIIASDNLNHRLLVFNPLGGAGWSIGQGDELPSLGAMAGDGRAVYAIDNGCACIVAMDEAGRVSGRIGQGELVQPRELAADRHGHIFVSDGGNRSLKVFLRGKLLASYGAQALRFTEISALAVDEDTLYLADGPGSQVLTFRIQTPIE